MKVWTSRIKREKVILYSIIFVILMSVISFLSACDIGSRYGNYSSVGGVELMSNKTHKKSLASRCEWDGDANSMEFTVPDEYDGYKVKCLGAKGNPGFSGRPSPFSVFLPSELDGLNSLGAYTFVPDDCTSENTINLNFTVNIGKSVSEIERIRKTALYSYGKRSNGQEETIRYYNMNIYFNVDGENKTFYSQGGDIYYRSSGKKVDYSL